MAKDSEEKKAVDYTTMPTNSPEYDERAHMEQVLSQGQSVLYKGRVYTSVDQLPTAADLAVESNNRDKAAEVEADIDARIKALQAQKEKLQGIKAPNTPRLQGQRADAKAPAAKVEDKAPAKEEGK